MWVAGPGALLVAKNHKIAERVDHSDRIRDKDALDVLRLLRATDEDEMAARLRRLRDDELAQVVTRDALNQLPRLFGESRSDGVMMAVRSAGGAEDGAVIAGSFVALVDDLEAALAAGTLVAHNRCPQLPICASWRYPAVRLSERAARALAGANPRAAGVSTGCARPRWRG
jgi:hypothetical protein